MPSGKLRASFEVPNLSRISPAVYLVTLVSLVIPVFVLFIVGRRQLREDTTSPPSGCRKIGIDKRPSNLSDQYQKNYSTGGDPGTASNGSPLWKVKALFVYPIKSCAGIELEQADIARTGVEHDRQFTFAQQVTSLPSLEPGPDGTHNTKTEWTFITQRTFPRLAKIETEVWVPDPSSPTYSTDAEYVQSEGCLVIRFPFSPDAEFSVGGIKASAKLLAARLSGLAEPTMEFRLPFNPPAQRIKQMGYPSEKLKIWKDQPEALDMSSEIPSQILEKLKYTLGVSNPLTLFRIDQTKYREVHRNAPKKAEIGFQPVIGMADSYPLHIMNLASVHHVASQLPNGYYKKFNALRYRANVYITGPPAFSEDSWAKARVGSSTLHISCRTTRCKLPNVDPATGIRDRNEPERTMKKYRVIDKGSASACLGMQVTPVTEGKIRVGDEVQVLEVGEHFFLKE